MKGKLLLDVAICIPARNEETELPMLLTALECLEVSGGTQVHVCLLLDDCTDGSAAQATTYQARSRHRVIIEQTASSNNAGLARHRAMLMGLAAVTATDGLLLTTDADSVPVSGWLRAMTSALKLADVVVGRIVRRAERPSDLQDRIEAYYDHLFALRRQIDPVPWEATATHHCSGGANLGIRAAAYRHVGGFQPLHSGEDARLLDDASRTGLRVRRDAASVVHTSDRRTGRALAGLASALRHLDTAEAGTVEVTHPADAAWQYRLHAAARLAYIEDRLDMMATALGLTPDHVRGVARDCLNEEAFAMRIVPTAPGGMRCVSLPIAEAELVRLFGQARAA